MKTNFDIFILILLLVCVYIVLGTSSPLIALLWLLMFFFINSLLLIFLDLDYVAFLLIIVYAGAVVVLFLFVIMFINMRYFETGVNKLSLSSLIVLLGIVVSLLNIQLFQNVNTTDLLILTSNTSATQMLWPYDYVLIEVLGYLFFDYMLSEFLAITLILFLGLDCVLILVLEFTKYIYEDIYIIFGEKTNNYK